MPVMTDVDRTPGANATSKGIFAQQLHEYVQDPGIVNIYCAASAAGLLMTVNIGNKVLIQDQEILAINTFPVRPDHLVLGGVVVRPGDRIVIDIRNRTGTAATKCSTIVDILTA